MDWPPLLFNWNWQSLISMVADKHELRRRKEKNLLIAAHLLLSVVHLSFKQNICVVYNRFVSHSSQKRNFRIRGILLSSSWYKKTSSNFNYVKINVTPRLNVRIKLANLEWEVLIYFKLYEPSKGIFLQLFSAQLWVNSIKSF